MNHRDAIRILLAHEDGKTVQWLDHAEEWTDWPADEMPEVGPNEKWRVKPDPQPARGVWVKFDENGWVDSWLKTPRDSQVPPNYVWCEETGRKGQSDERLTNKQR